MIVGEARQAMEVDIPVVAMTEVRQAHIPHAVFVEALESVQVAMDGAANGAVLGITQVPARRHG